MGVKLKRKVHIKTYGCQMNVYDSLRMEELFTPFGYEVSDSYDAADLVILNTCHIREKAAEKVYSELGRINKRKQKLLKSGKRMVIAVAGCVAQAEGDQIVKRAPYVDVVVGPQSYHNLPGLVDKVQKEQSIDKVCLDFIEEKKFDHLPMERVNNNVSAFLSVQEGCDKFCTYCVVPYTRGAEFSRPAQAIIDEAKKLVDHGAKEINLLGQNVNAYHGNDVKGKSVSLGKLIMTLGEISGLERIRYTTSHPSDMHDELYEAHAVSSKLMPYLHLPVQHGSDRILKMMNRKHGRDEYLEAIDKLKIARPDLTFSSDFIVGFPGETDQDFQETLDLVKTVEYSGCFSFKFSPRPGTPAALYDDQVPEEVKSERLSVLQALLKEQQYAFNKTFEGKDLDVLFERVSGDQLIGRSPYLHPVCIDYDKSLEHQLVKVNITRSGPYSLNAKMIDA